MLKKYNNNNNNIIKLLNQPKYPETAEAPKRRLPAK